MYVHKLCETIDFIVIMTLEILDCSQFTQNRQMTSNSVISTQLGRIMFYIIYITARIYGDLPIKLNIERYSLHWWGFTVPTFPPLFLRKLRATDNQADKFCFTQNF